MINHLDLRINQLSGRQHDASTIRSGFVLIELQIKFSRQYQNNVLNVFLGPQRSLWAQLNPIAFDRERPGKFY